MVTPIAITHGVQFVYRLSYRVVCLSILAQLHYLIVEKGKITKYDPKQKLIWTVGTLVTLPSKYHTIHSFYIKVQADSSSVIILLICLCVYWITILPAIIVHKTSNLPTFLRQYQSIYLSTSQSSSIPKTHPCFLRLSI